MKFAPVEGYTLNAIRFTRILLIDLNFDVVVPKNLEVDLKAAEERTEHHICADNILGILAALFALPRCENLHCLGSDFATAAEGWPRPKKRQIVNWDLSMSSPTDL